MHGGWWVHAVLLGPSISEILFAARGCPVFPPSRIQGPVISKMSSHRYAQVFVRHVLKHVTSKPSISGCWLSESQAVPSDLNLNISQSDGMIQGEVRAQAQGTFQTHLW